MSYDLMVFEPTKAPKTRAAFLAWYEQQVQWQENHDYQTVSVASLALQHWFLAMKETFPPMNGEFALDEALLDEDDALESHITDYSIGREMIYGAFAWSVAEEAYTTALRLAKIHGVGFFDVSSDAGEIILPDGIIL